MRQNFCLLLLLWIASFAAAAPADLENQTDPADATEARNYAVQLYDLATTISQTYVKPVSRAGLLTAALEGLYAEARATPPAGLRAELGKQIKDPADLTDPPTPGVTPQPDLDAIALLTRYRQEAGNLPAIRGPAGLRVSLEAMLQTLDPYSTLITSEELRRGRGESQSGGFGFDWIDDADGLIKVKSVAVGGPAERAGIRPGDRLAILDFRSPRVSREMVSRGSLSGFLRMAQPGDSAEVAVKRSGAIDRSVKLDHEFFQPESAFGVRRHSDGSWNHWIDLKHKIGYVRVGALDKGSADAVERAVANLKADGMRGLILDLRWCPGGFLNEAVLIGRMFIKDGMITRVESRYRQDDQEYNARTGEAYDGFAMVVLVNAETSGGAELIAAALQDNGRALVAGQRSRGKASVQTTIAVPIPDTGMKVTTGTFLRPNGKALHRTPRSRPQDDWGVRPEADLETPVDLDLSRQLSEEYIMLALRPSWSREAFLLDDPENDPQRQEAVRKLAGLVRGSGKSAGR